MSDYDPTTFFKKRSHLKREPNYSKMIDAAVTKAFNENTIVKKQARGNVYQHTVSGTRLDLDISFRSKWEANLARVLNAYKIKFEFEPKVFSYPIKRGTVSYMPDFYLPKTKEWIEVKGFLDNKSKVKLKRFKRYYPEEANKLILVISKYSKVARTLADELGVDVIFYENLKKTYMDKVPYWES